MTILTCFRITERGVINQCPWSQKTTHVLMTVLLQDQGQSTVCLVIKFLPKVPAWCWEMEIRGIEV
jgi:hypothetical protein